MFKLNSQCHNSKHLLLCNTVSISNNTITSFSCRLNLKANRITESLNIADRVHVLAPKRAYLTFKGHKANFMPRRRPNNSFSLDNISCPFNLWMIFVIIYLWFNNVIPISQLTFYNFIVSLQHFTASVFYYYLITPSWIIEHDHSVTSIIPHESPQIHNSLQQGHVCRQQSVLLTVTLKKKPRHPLQLHYEFLQRHTISVNHKITGYCQW